jgi:iron complex transport system substrate-binding protein
MMRRRGLLAALAAPAVARAAPLRVVCAGGAITEIAFALGHGHRVVAVDATSRFPAAVQALPQIGYMRALPPEGVVSLRPDLLLLSSDAGPETAIAVLRAAGVAMRVIPDRPGVDGVVAKIDAVADALGADPAPLREAFCTDAALLDAPLASAQRPRVLFLLSLSRGAPLASGRETGASAMIGWSGGRNAIEAFSGYRPLSAEAALDAAPEVILMMEHSVRDAGGADAVLALPQLAFTAAARARRLVTLDGSYAIAWGPRAAHARRDIAAGFGHRDLPSLPARAWT